MRKRAEIVEYRSVLLKQHLSNEVIIHSPTQEEYKVKNLVLENKNIEIKIAALDYVINDGRGENEEILKQKLTQAIKENHFNYVTELQLKNRLKAH